MATSTVTYVGHLRTICKHLSSGETVFTDAPIDNAGKGQAFSPTDLAATALGTCMLTVMGIAANGRGIEFGNPHCTITKIMAANPRRISRIIVNVAFDSVVFNESQRNVLEEIGRNCPVALSLHPDIEQEITFTYA